jgi:hypothetical protein
MLQMGSSKPWPDAMEVLTGQRDMDATGLLDYFSPLADWLERDNRQSGEYVGWEPTEKRKGPLSDILDDQFGHGTWDLTCWHLLLQVACRPRRIWNLRPGKTRRARKVLVDARYGRIAFFVSVASGTSHT